MSDFYRFPAMAKLGEWTNEQQADKVRGESLEACNALWDYDMGARFGKPDTTKRRTAYGMELMDVIHAVETALRMEFPAMPRWAVCAMRWRTRTEREDITNRGKRR